VSYDWFRDTAYDGDNSLEGTFVHEFEGDIHSALLDKGPVGVDYVGIVSLV
jgi:hypothetical protein